MTEAQIYWALGAFLFCQAQVGAICILANIESKRHAACHQELTEWMKLQEELNREYIAKGVEPWMPNPNAPFAPNSPTSIPLGGPPPIQHYDDNWLKENPGE